ncbi:MAG: long-chain fatty acid--CoA ligase, partial [Conexibacter sp.]|nr:long-chain fatty acid--CoA ligase [Conexibacter sp.]
SAGKPSMHVQIRLVDETGAEAEPGAEGEILVRAPSMTAGYWDAPELNASLLADGWLRTGDVGRFDEDGYLFIVGRKGDMIISGGMNVFPAEIEDVLRNHPDVFDVAVIGVPHEKWGETVCAVVEVTPGVSIDEAQLIAFCGERLASFKKPTSVHVVDEIPRTVSGKAQKYLLRERFGGGQVGISSPGVRNAGV